MVVRVGVVAHDELNEVEPRVPQRSSTIKRITRRMSALLHPSVNRTMTNSTDGHGASRRLMDPTQAATQYLCVTISNTRPASRALIAKPEDCFIPFKQKGAGALLFLSMEWTDDFVGVAAAS